VSTPLERKLAALSVWKKDVESEARKDPGAPAILDPSLSYDALPSGSPTFDGLLGGGWPRGKFIQLYGVESTGKSTLAYQTIAELHRRDPNALALLVDAEGAYDPRRAARMGIIQDNLIVLTLRGAADKALDEADQALKMRDPETGRSYIELVVLDSIASLVPKAEAEDEIGAQTMALLARLMSQALRKLNLSVVTGGATVILINQLREKVGVMYGNNETQPGGRALKHYPALNIKTRAPASEAFKNKAGEKIAIQTHIGVEKNKVTGRFGETLTRITPRSGLDFGWEVVKAGSKCGLVTRSGSFYSLSAGALEIKVQGEETLIAAINKLAPAERNALYDLLVRTLVSADDFYAPEDVAEEIIAETEVPEASADEGAALAEEDELA
jgi:recombination protein RecA